jgi:hypothetical protein
MSVNIDEVVIENGPLPEGDLYAYSYDPITSSVFLVKKVIPPVVPVNTSRYSIGTTAQAIVLQTLAPFPPAFYDATWYNPIDYTSVDTRGPYENSDTHTSQPDMVKVVKIIDDIHAKPTPSCFSIALVTQEDSIHQLFWRCINYIPTGVLAPPNANRWISSENVYKYKAGGVYFGGKNYSGPLNTILIDNQTGLAGTEFPVLDMNEFRVNSNNETDVDAYCCNYSTTSSVVYCLIDKTTGRVAEINANTREIRYFTLVVPANSTICQLYYTTRLMYTVKNNLNTIYTLYDASGNGTILHTFNLGTFDLAVIPKFSIIN